MGYTCIVAELIKSFFWGALRPFKGVIAYCQEHFMREQVEYYKVFVINIWPQNNY